MDEDLDRMFREELVGEVKKLRQAIRQHRDSTRHELCWHHPALWGLLPEKIDPVPVVPDWPEFMEGCVRYRQSLDVQAPDAPRTRDPARGDSVGYDGAFAITRCSGNSVSPFLPDESDMTTADASFEMALPDNVQRVLPFIKSYYRFDGIPFQLAQLETALEALLRDPSRGRVWIICVDSKDIGYVVLTFGYELEFGGPQATLTEFYIIPAYRRRGIGMRTIQFVEDRCRELGIGALELQVGRDNTAAQAFYRKLQFEVHDRIPMSKKLNHNCGFQRWR